MTDRPQTRQQKKPEHTQEETKGDRPPRREGGRGGRGGRGGASAATEGGEQRPRTTGGAHRGGKDERPHYQRRKDAGEGTEEGGEGKQQHQRKEQDKNSWAYKFHYAERPKHERVEVTMETVVPETIPKDQRKKNPEKADFDNKMRNFDAQIETIKSKIAGLIQKKKEVLDGGKMQGSSVTFKDFIKGKIEELKAIRDKKNVLEGKKNDLTDKINDLIHERDTLQKSLPPGKDNQNPERIQQLITESQRRYETTTLKPVDEKKLLADIEKMKKSIPNAKRLGELKPVIDGLYDERKQVYDQLTVFKKEIETKSGEIDKVRKEQDDAREQREDIKKELDKFNEDIDKQREELNKVFANKDALREEFFKARYEFEVEQDLLRHIDQITKDKERLVNKEKAKEERLQARKQALADRPNPFQKEIDTCERLLSYCQLIKKKLGLV